MSLHSISSNLNPPSSQINKSSQGWNPSLGTNGFNESLGINTASAFTTQVDVTVDSTALHFITNVTALTQKLNLLVAENIKTKI